MVYNYSLFRITRGEYHSNLGRSHDEDSWCSLPKPFEYFSIQDINLNWKAFAFSPI